MMLEAALLYLPGSHSADHIWAFFLKLIHKYAKRKSIPCLCDSILSGSVSLCFVKRRLLNGAQWRTERGGVRPAWTQYSQTVPCSIPRCQISVRSHSSLSRSQIFSVMISFIRNSQPFPSFFTSACKYRAPSCGLHAFTETVFVLPFSVTGIICFFHLVLLYTYIYQTKPCNMWHKMLKGNHFLSFAVY